VTTSPFETPNAGVAGARTDRYTIDRQLGIGGMAEIWRAKLNKTSDWVVLKMALPHLAADPEFSAMFVREASLSIQLCHPNIINVQDIGCLSGRFFIEMEYVDGRTLRELLRRVSEEKTMLSLDFVLSTMIDCCNALDYVHTFCDLFGSPLGLVHRDLSPENVMVSRDGQTKVLDFGVASAPSAVQTQAGQLKGKLHYMAPEVFQGARPAPQRDIYALGATLYELLTGRRPFVAKNDAELMFRISEGKLNSARTMRPDIPLELDALVTKALAKNAKDRLSTVREFGAELTKMATNLDHQNRRDCIAEAMARFCAMPEPAIVPPKPAPFASENHKLEFVATPDPLAAIRSRMSSLPVAESRSLEFESAAPPSSFYTPTDLFSRPRTEPPRQDPNYSDVFSRSDVFTPADATFTPVTTFTPSKSFTPVSGRAVGSDIFALYGRAETQIPAPAAPVESEESAKASLHFERGLKFREQGLLQAALEEWNQALTLNPHNKMFQANIRRVKQRMDLDFENNKR
jgi:serine/threonine protein kinase